MATCHLLLGYGYLSLTVRL